jgi:hypothetical protein
MKPPVYPIAYDLSKAAEMHGVTRRWLQEWLWKHPCDSNGIPYYRKAGRTKLFREADIVRIFASLSTPEPLLPPMLGRGRGNANAFSPRRARANDYEEAKALLAALKNPRSSAKDDGKGDLGARFFGKFMGPKTSNMPSNISSNSLPRLDCKSFDFLAKFAKLNALRARQRPGTPTAAAVSFEDDQASR